MAILTDMLSNLVTAIQLLLPVLDPLLKWISTKDRKPAKMIKLSMDMEKDCAQNQAKVKNVKKSESIMKNQEYKPVAGTEENTIECNLLPFLMRKA
ncbi:hypothetical protein Tco_0260098 [Tanacetum coccineum]